GSPCQASSTSFAGVGTGLDRLRTRGDSGWRSTGSRRRILDHITAVTTDFLVGPVSIAAQPQAGPDSALCLDNEPTAHGIEQHGPSLSGSTTTKGLHAR